ncbi:putative ion transporter superfamily protein YfcC [Bacillus thermophilus]|uniref:Ion transporter superfamily protein YfcC n=1 Tax=Siminovitchia thermophila TaxID=1245522 RepID=A0ABS2R465_9BACI|nr:YfcC family protein [Siminovitchia thermophila]MBM7713934.1 putative ion transporter superfamily protein YfcC [Siminovitchia thermophila]ONK23820.1 C4-dicarboxylate ABC transporter [Bacillus sp. VT-16-64]
MDTVQAKKQEPRNFKKKFFNLENIHPYVVILSIVFLIYILSLVLPSGEFDRVENENGDVTVVAGTYKTIEKDLPSVFALFKNIQLGFVDTASITFFIIFAYVFVHILTVNGTLSVVLGNVVDKLKNKTFLFIPISMVMFGILGATVGLYEEVYGLIPVFIGVAIALGYDAIVGGAIVFVGVATGFAAALTNPFTIGIAQEIANVPLSSGLSFRLIVFIIFEIAVISYVMYYAHKVKKDPTKSILYGTKVAAINQITLKKEKLLWKHKLSLLALIITFAMIIYSTLKLGWYIDELAALFLLMFFIVGFLSGYSLGRIMDIFIDGAKQILFGILTIGFIKGAIITMEDAAILDTVIYYLSFFLVGTNSYLTSLGMLFSQNLINLFISGGAAQAMATMPIMAPITDLAGMDRQIAVIAFQFGDGFSNMFWPTGVAIECAIMGISMVRWYRFIMPLFGIMLVLQVILMMVATAIF